MLPKGITNGWPWAVGAFGWFRTSKPSMTPGSVSVGLRVTELSTSRSSSLHPAAEDDVLGRKH